MWRWSHSVRWGFAWSSRETSTGARASRCVRVQQLVLRLKALGNSLDMLVFFHYMLSGNRFTSLWLTKLNSSALSPSMTPPVEHKNQSVCEIKPTELLSTPSCTPPHSTRAHTRLVYRWPAGGGTWSSAVLGCLVLHLPINARHKQSRQAL